MSQWAHGYNVSQGYTYGFYREMAPDWIDLCVMAAGYTPPRRGEGGSFRYLELGCGQGFGLCLLAAANPVGSFVGVDFNASHIAHARELAAAVGLDNVCFVEADFAELGQAWPADFGQFDYTALHGIYSWVPPHVRRALLRCLAAAVPSGGAVYNSYNAMPGWTATLPFQHMMQRLHVTTNKPGAEAIDAAVELFDALLEKTQLATTLPGLKGRVDSVRTQTKAYLVQEYLHQHWQPFWFSQVAEEFGSVKLEFVAAGTAVELLLPGVLQPATRELVTAQTDPVFAQEVQDCILSQSFRRDIFCRGPRRTTGWGEDRGRGARFHSLAAAIPPKLTITTSFGELTLQPDLFIPILEALGDRSLTLQEIAGLPALEGKGVNHALQTVIMLIHAGLAAGAMPASSNPAIAQRFNAVTARAASAGAPYGYLAMPAIGSGLPATDIDCMLIDSMLADGATETAALAAGLSQRLNTLGRRLLHEGQQLDDAAMTKRIDELAGEFLAGNLPRWRRLGALV